MVMATYLPSAAANTTVVKLCTFVHLVPAWEMHGIINSLSSLLFLLRSNQLLLVCTHTAVLFPAVSTAVWINYIVSL